MQNIIHLRQYTVVGNFPVFMRRLKVGNRDTVQAIRRNS